MGQLKMIANAFKLRCTRDDNVTTLNDVVQTTLKRNSQNGTRISLLSFHLFRCVRARDCTAHMKLFEHAFYGPVFTLHKSFTLRNEDDCIPITKCDPGLVIMSGCGLHFFFNVIVIMLCVGVTLSVIVHPLYVRAEKGML